MPQESYCKSRVKSIRRHSREVSIGNIRVGGQQPIRIQSMTTSLTQDVDATVAQVLRLAEAGCEIVRITAPNKEAARALKDIHRKVREAKVDVPLVADIHFLPAAAMEAIEHVEKVRVNPGNYADKKKFAVLEYTDQAYESELQRLYDAFSPLVKRAKELGRTLRIGTNHGSLSDRIMNRYGDSPLGMVESALEFIRIAESHGFHDIVLSMKASNTKIMIEAYRLAAQKMAEENMHYPLHLGVTEAGDGEDARIKSAIGIGALLYDGLGDTIRVSLTEDPWYEIPVCIDLARRAEEHWKRNATLPDLPDPDEGINPYQYQRRDIIHLDFGPECPLSSLEPPRVIVPAAKPLSAHADIVKDVLTTHSQLKDNRIESLLLTLESPEDCPILLKLQSILTTQIRCLVVELNPDIDPDSLQSVTFPRQTGWMLVRRFQENDQDLLCRFLRLCADKGLIPCLDLTPETLEVLAPAIRESSVQNMVFTCSNAGKTTHPVGSIRCLAALLRQYDLKGPLWLRMRKEFQIQEMTHFGAVLLESSMFHGSLFVDGYGDLISVENTEGMPAATALAYNILQGARMRASKTEYVACPSCGRTLFNLQEVTARIKARTGHLKGVTIAVMGCIVNGPGEMADADFGYVGGAPNKVNLYVGKECVQYNIPEEEAIDRLIDLIKKHNKWVEPAEKTV